jgi:hypothetical protein
MTLKTKLGKAEHEALDESLKTLYIPDGDGFKLDADFEDVDGLKAKRDELLGKVTETSKALKAFEGLDPKAAREALAKVNELEEADLLGKRKFDELFEKKKTEWDEERTTLSNKISTMIEKQAESQLAMTLTKHGVKPHLADDLAVMLKVKHLDYIEQDGEPIWKTKDGLETVDLDKYIPGLKENGKADYFGSSLGQGSGTPPGSQNTSGNAKTLPKSQWDTLDHKAQAAFIKDGGKPVD